MTEFWFAAGGVAALLLVAVLVWRVYGSRSRSPGNALENPKFIAATLNEAHDRRSIFEVRFEDPELRDRSLRGPCEAVEGHKLLIDVNLRSNAPSWINRRVRVFFNISGPRSTAFYSFFTTVVELPKRGGTFLVALPFPRKLRNEQRRAFVRLSPRRSMVNDLSIWLKGSAVAGIKAPSAMPEPDVEFKKILLDNISAGGARVILRGPLDIPVDKGRLIRIHALLAGAENKGDLSLWLDAEVLMAKPQRDGLVLGLRFRRWTQEGDDPHPELSWFPVTDDGAVPPLAAWVMHKHLEIHHDSPE